MAQKAKTFPTPVDPALDGKVAATGSNYPDKFFINPWNGGLDERFDYDNDAKTLRSPTDTPGGMGLQLHGKDSYDSNWEHGYRNGVEGGKKGRK